MPGSLDEHMFEHHWDEPGEDRRHDVTTTESVASWSAAARQQPTVRVVAAGHAAQVMVRYGPAHRARNSRPGAKSDMPLGP
jgi:hypothetical protein